MPDPADTRLFVLRCLYRCRRVPVPVVHGMFVKHMGVNGTAAAAAFGAILDDLFAAQLIDRAFGVDLNSENVVVRELWLTQKGVEAIEAAGPERR